MKSMVGLPRTFGKVGPRFVKTVGFVAMAGMLAIAQASFQPPLPQVSLDAEGLTPRPIEQLTGTTVARHYALAWRDMANALESNLSGTLGEEFVGFAKDRLTRRIAEQTQTGVHVRIVDHGHHLTAVFYSADGTAMQLLDQARIEIQIFDGNKLLATQDAPSEFLVLMTPGADRWYVRDLEQVSARSF